MGRMLTLRPRRMHGTASANHDTLREKIYAVVSARDAKARTRLSVGRTKILAENRGAIDGTAPALRDGMKTTIESTAGGYSVLINGIFRGWRKTRGAAERLAASLYN